MRTLNAGQKADPMLHTMACVTAWGSITAPASCGTSSPQTASAIAPRLIRLTVTGQTPDCVVAKVSCGSAFPTGIVTKHSSPRQPAHSEPLRVQKAGNKRAMQILQGLPTHP